MTRSELTGYVRGIGDALDAAFVCRFGADYPLIESHFDFTDMGCGVLCRYDGVIFAVVLPSGEVHSYE